MSQIIDINIPLALTSASSRIVAVRSEINQALREIPDSAPLFAAVDVVVALGHLKKACERLSRAGKSIEDAGVVQ